MNDYPLETTVYFRFTTRSFTTGAPSALGSGTVSVMEDGTDAAMTAVSATVVASSVTGLNLVTVTATSANGFESGKEYDVYVSAGTVSGVSIVGEVVGHFSIQKASALRPTTATRTLDVSAGGEAGIDWANVGSPTTTVALTGTTLNNSIKKNAALAKFMFLMTDSTNHNPATALTVTCTRSIDGGAFAAGTLGTPTAISNGMYYVDFAAGDLNGNVITLRCTATGADDAFITIVTTP